MIAIKDLEFSYGKKSVFKNISLDFEKGHIYGLLGENGVGKTTLLKLISGLQKPSKGSCYVNEVASYDRRPDMLSQIFFISEDFAIPNSTPLKYVTALGAFYPRFNLEYFKELSKEFEIDPQQRYACMSFGQKKKALIATALSLRTDYLLLDEPTNGLDIPSKTIFRRVISQYCSDDNTIIISTHQVKDIENLIDPIIILDSAEVLLKASFKDITDKLYFDYSTTGNSEAIYQEMIPGGFINILSNNEGLDSKVNIETLFNAVLKNKNTIKQILNK